MYTFVNSQQEPIYYVVEDNETYQESHFEKIKVLLCFGFCHQHEEEEHKQNITIPNEGINLITLFTYCKYFLCEKKTRY